MNHLNKTSSRIMEFICQDLKDYKKIDNTNGSLMPVVVEVIGQVKSTGTGRLISMAHYGEQNGDLMRDPEIIFIEGEDINGNKTYFPVEFRNDYVGIHQELIIIRDQEIKGQRPTLQRDVTIFANTWLRNIKQQQNLKIKIKQVENFEKLTSENTQIFPEII